MAGAEAIECGGGEGKLEGITTDYGSSGHSRARDVKHRCALIQREHAALEVLREKTSAAGDVQNSFEAERAQYRSQDSHFLVPARALTGSIQAGTEVKIVVFRRAPFVVSPLFNVQRLQSSAA